MPTDPNKIKPPFSIQDKADIQEALDDAGINPNDHFTIPQNPDPQQPGRFTNPGVPEGRIKENYNGQKGNGTFTELDFGWQPGCDEPFAIVISEAWTPPPANLAAQFQTWAAFATVRAILICLRNKERCRRVMPLGCESGWDIRFPNGKHYARARFVFQCVDVL